MMSNLSMSDVDIYIQLHHRGELTESETDMLAVILRSLHAEDLLDRETYERRCGPVADDWPDRVVA